MEFLPNAVPVICTSKSANTEITNAQKYLGIIFFKSKNETKMQIISEAIDIPSCDINEYILSPTLD